jgi:hypothetical protein
MKRITQIVIYSLLAISIILLLGNLARYFGVDFLPSKWGPLFLFRLNPLLCSALIVFLITACLLKRYWSKLGVSQPFIIALWGPAFAISFGGFLYSFINRADIPAAGLPARFIEYPWRGIFAAGILSSVWVQLAAAHYFDEKGYTTSAQYPNSLIRTMNEVMKASMTACAICALGFMEFYNLHIVFSVIYMALVSFWDLSILRGSEPALNKRVEHEKFKKCCSQLFWHVDGLVFGTVLLWVVLIYAVIIRGHRTFSLVSEINTFLAQFGPLTKDNIGQLAKHGLEEPLMGGVIGFHAIFSAALLMIHFRDWEKDERSTKTAEASEQSTQASATSE